MKSVSQSKSKVLLLRLALLVNPKSPIFFLSVSFRLFYSGCSVSPTTTAKHLLVSTLASLSLPVLMFVIACVVQDISTTTEALRAFIFLAALASVLFVSYWLSGEVQLRRENASVKTGLWCSALFSGLITLVFSCYTIYSGMNSIQIVLGASIVFLLFWLIHFTGSLMQYVRMTDDA